MKQVFMHITPAIPQRAPITRPVHVNRDTLRSDQGVRLPIITKYCFMGAERLSSRRRANLHHLISFVFALLILFAPARARSINPPPFQVKVNDFAAVLDPRYRSDLNRRLMRFDAKTGYAIYVVVVDGHYSESLSSIVTDMFNQLEDRGSAGTVLLLIDRRDRQVAIATSRNLHKIFSRFQIERYIENVLDHNSRAETAMEIALNAILGIIDPWFYVLDPPSPPFDFLTIRPPIAEIILFPTAPLLGLMTGLVLMAFTSAGSLPWLARFFVSGYLGCSILVILAFLIRQPGGIMPGVFYYGAVMSFAVSGIVGALRPLWFGDKFKGKRSDKWWAGPVHFRRG